jgi:hypothetical protein
LHPHNNEYYQTKNALKLCKSFVVGKFPEQFEVSKADQAEMLNRSVKFFKQNEDFDIDNFANEVMQVPDVISSFKSYKTEFEVEHDLKLPDNFDISNVAIKKQSKFFRSVIKLDKNFHIYVHGDGHQIIKGFDQASGMHYYQLFFKEER